MSKRKTQYEDLVGEKQDLLILKLFNIVEELEDRIERIEEKMGIITISGKELKRIIDNNLDAPIS